MTKLDAIVIDDGGSSVDIPGIEIHDGNEEHLTRHGASITQA